MVSAGRLISIVGPDSAPIKRIVQEARDRGVLIDPLVQHVLQLGQVAAQAHQLFVHGDLVGKDGRLGEDAALVQLGVLEDLGHFGGQRAGCRPTFPGERWMCL